MTTEDFTTAARAEAENWIGMDLDDHDNFVSGAEWARDHLAAQEPTNAECGILLRVMYPDIPFNSPSHYPDAMERARAAIRAVRRDEEK